MDDLHPPESGRHNKSWADFLTWSNGQKCQGLTASLSGWAYFQLQSYHSCQVRESTKLGKTIIPIRWSLFGRLGELLVMYMYSMFGYEIRVSFAYLLVLTGDIIISPHRGWRCTVGPPTKTQATGAQPNVVKPLDCRSLVHVVSFVNPIFGCQLWVEERRCPTWWRLTPDTVLFSSWISIVWPLPPWNM